MPVWPFINYTTRARVQITLEIVKDGEVYTEECIGEKIDNNIKLDFFMPAPEEPEEDLDKMKFGSEEFWKSFPGKAVNKAVQECMVFIKLWVPKKK